MNLDMTLREFFELSARVGDAARVIREAQAMMGGVQPQSAIEGSRWPEVFYDPKPRPVTLPTPTASDGVLLTNKGPVTLTPEEQAQKDRLRMEREARELEVMPDNIKAVMAGKS